MTEFAVIVTTIVALLFFFLSYAFFTNKYHNIIMRGSVWGFDLEKINNNKIDKFKFHLGIFCLIYGIIFLSIAASHYINYNFILWLFIILGFFILVDILFRKKYKK
ncbi:hypothetical protein SAMN02745221_02200 [Thermosyntropha lipolytica DSM 11003]|uniref:DUF3784 domain-containing protein n=1 Tax=Thermosyntropha lipolytica DSM 11003 TaxID=1123382 RepID=A0A1M5SBU3_9FIRM|nr:hypothetical protein [Thermosyntropha lipolytica]SHH35986.1 hypothetical protein SAMN02745221_02200 [Thermosyntropha lipolytica DSM 11003]